MENVLQMGGDRDSMQEFGRFNTPTPSRISKLQVD